MSLRRDDCPPRESSLSETAMRVSVAAAAFGYVLRQTVTYLNSSPSAQDDSPPLFETVPRTIGAQIVHHDWDDTAHHNDMESKAESSRGFDGTMPFERSTRYAPRTAVKKKSIRSGVASTEDDIRLLVEVPEKYTVNFLRMLTNISEKEMAVANEFKERAKVSALNAILTSLESLLSISREQVAAVENGDTSAVERLLKQRKTEEQKLKQCQKQIATLYNEEIKFVHDEVRETRETPKKQGSGHFFSSFLRSATSERVPPQTGPSVVVSPKASPSFSASYELRKRPPATSLVSDDISRQKTNKTSSSRSLESSMSSMSKRSSSSKARWTPYCARNSISGCQKRSRGKKYKYMCRECFNASRRTGAKRPEEARRDKHVNLVDKDEVSEAKDVAQQEDEDFEDAGMLLEVLDASQEGALSLSQVTLSSDLQDQGEEEDKDTEENGNPNFPRSEDEAGQDDDLSVKSDTTEKLQYNVAFKFPNNSCCYCEKEAFFAEEGFNRGPLYKCNQKEVNCSRYWHLGCQNVLLAENGHAVLREIYRKTFVCSECNTFLAMPKEEKQEYLNSL